MGNFIMFGADVHDDWIVMRRAIGSAQAETARYRNTQRGRQTFMKDALRYAGDDRRRLRVAYEAGPHGFTFCKQLQAAGIWCRVLAPHRLDRSAHARRQKTDVKDAQRILDVVRAHVLAGAHLPEVWMPDAQTIDDREVVNFRLRVAEEVTARKNAITSLLRKYDVEPTYRTKSRWTQSYWRGLKELADDHKKLNAGARFQLQMLMRALQFALEQKDMADAALVKLASHDRYASAVTAMCAEPGVGLITVMTVLVVLGDPHRFSNRRQIGSYAGLVPGMYESGKNDNRKGRITRQGPPRLRKVLCQAVQCALAKSPALRERRDAIAARATHAKKATVALMRELMIRLWRIAKDHCPPVAA